MIFKFPGLPNIDANGNWQLSLTKTIIKTKYCYSYCHVGLSTHAKTWINSSFLFRITMKLIKKSHIDTNQSFQSTNIKIGSLNINGSLCRKLNFPEVKSFIESTDICAIQESWMLPGEELHFASYKHFKNIRKPKKKAKRGSGGLIILYKGELEKGITREKSNDEKHAIWIKCDKEFFNLQEHLFLATVYFPPQGSLYLDDPDTTLSKFEKDVSKFSNFGDICIIGDLNARISDFSENFLINDFLSINPNDNLAENIQNTINKRVSEDPKNNKRGKTLQKIINENKLVLLNGRKIGDTTGNFTCHEWNGSSVVDLCFCDHTLYSKITSFRVLSHNWFSDHCPILTTITTNKNNNTTNKWDNTVTTPTPMKFIWNEQGAEHFYNISESRPTKESLNELKRDNDPDQIATKLENIILNIAHKSLKTATNSKQKPTNQTQQWMTADLIKERTDFVKARKSFLGEKNNKDRRLYYMNKRKKIKKNMYLVKRAFQEKKMNEIGKLVNKSPNDFWKAVKKLIQSTKENKNNSISPRVWTNYFKQILNAPQKTNYDQWITKINPELDKSFTEIEIQTALRSCKNNKSSSTSVTFEMIKCNLKLFLPTLKYLFDKVLFNNLYPKTWGISHLVPLYKTDDQTNPSNYRGIAVGNHISKIFAKCLNSRLENFIRLHKLLPDNSLGFRKGVRTEDAMFVLKKVSEKYQNLGKKMYTVFVDFSKFYDTIDHGILLDKLYKLGISGNVFNVIRNMYRGLITTKNINH